MRIALISDIHGNYVSLEAVLADIARQQVDELVCLGDVADLGPRPNAVVNRLRDLSCRCIMGNHEEQLLDPEFQPSRASWTDIATSWCLERLSPDNLAYLRTFVATLEIALGDQATLLCCHGSPRSNSDFLLSTTRHAELDRMLDGCAATALACGHTHLQMLRQHKGMIIVNPGSVGQPFEMLPWSADVGPRILPWAEYAILKCTEGVLTVEFRRVPIDIDEVKQQALDSHMPDAQYWVSMWCA